MGIMALGRNMLTAALSVTYPDGIGFIFAKLE